MRKQLTMILLIFIFVLAVIANVALNERNFQRLAYSFSEMYNDRLIAESYVYQLSDLLYKKKIALLSLKNNQMPSAGQSEIKQQTLEISELTRKYALTKLTTSERLIFERFRENSARLETGEADLFTQKNAGTGSLLSLCTASIDQLRLLSSIQVSEGKLLNESSKGVLSSAHLSAQLEWAVCIIVLLLLGAILRKRTAPAVPKLPTHQLN